MAELKHAGEVGEEINEQEHMFGWAMSKYANINKMVQKLEPFQTLWTTCYEFFESFGKWMNGPFSHLNAEEVDEQSADMFRRMYKSSKLFSGVSSNSPPLEGPMKVADEVCVLTIDLIILGLNLVMITQHTSKMN